MTLAEDCFRLRRGFPREELFGMSAQIRRSAASIAANIAEGHGREHTGSFVQFLRVAQDSLKELETHPILAERVQLTAGEKLGPFLSQCDEIGRMLRSLIRSLQKRAEKGITLMTFYSLFAIRYSPANPEGSP
jgi:four helix bundle protein